MSDDVGVSGPAGLLAAAMLELSPPGVRSGLLQVDDRHVASLHASEAAHVRCAVATRRREFATGRALLRQLTATSDPIGVSPERAPLVPDGWSASLAHSDRFAVAVAADRSSYRALGIDLEPMGPMEPDERSVVLRDDDPELDGRAALVLKEAAYKAWSGLGGPLIDFHQVRLELDGDTFVAFTPRPEIVLRGRWAGIADHWLAVVTDPAPG